MKLHKSYALYLLSMLFLFNCGSVKVINSWKSEKENSLDSKNILVIARTANDKVRQAFEDKITKSLKARKLNATESYKKYPKINPGEKLTEEKIESIKNIFQGDGFNAVVVTVLKDIKEISVTTTEGGYEAGASLSSYYTWGNIGFFGYYADPIAYPSFDGVYVPKTSTTETANLFILETSSFNLDLHQEDQLLAVVTSKIEEQEDFYKLAGEYAKAIMKSIR